MVWVYAKDKFKKENNKKRQIAKLINNLNDYIKITEENEINDNYFKNLASDLNKLLFMKDLLERVFIYALYHAKAKGD